MAKRRGRRSSFLNPGNSLTAFRELAQLALPINQSTHSLPPSALLDLVKDHLDGRQCQAAPGSPHLTYPPLALPEYPGRSKPVQKAQPPGGEEPGESLVLAHLCPCAPELPKGACTVSILQTSWGGLKMALTALKQPKASKILDLCFCISQQRFRGLISKPCLPLNLCGLYNPEIPFLFRHQIVLLTSQYRAAA